MSGVMGVILQPDLFDLGVSYRNGEMAFQEASCKEKPALI